MKNAVKLMERPHALMHADVRKQQGVVLLIALIVLVAMTLASVAMVRSVDTSTMIASNLAFKQSGMASGDAGVNAAVTWLNANGGALQNDMASSGYYASSQDCLDLTGNGAVPTNCTPPFTAFDWNQSGASMTLPTDAAGNSVSYVIHRLCSAAGALNGASCTLAQTERTGSGTGAARQMRNYQPGAWSTVSSIGYYRITVRIVGPRKNVSFVQAVVSR